MLGKWSLASRGECGEGNEVQFAVGYDEEFFAIANCLSHRLDECVAERPGEAHDLCRVAGGSEGGAELTAHLFDRLRFAEVERQRIATAHDHESRVMAFAEGFRSCWRKHLIADVIY